MRKTPKSIKAKYDEQNLEAARIIAADPVKISGRNAGMGDAGPKAVGTGRREAYQQ
jgi:hypothetical protein